MLSFPKKIEMQLRHFLHNEEDRWALELRSYDSDHAWRVLKTFQKKPKPTEVSSYKNLVNMVISAYLDGVKVAPVMPFSFKEEEEIEESPIQIGPIVKKVTSDPIINEVIQKFSDRSERGLKKYGTTLAREDLTEKEWLTHLQEELLDGAGYLQVLLNRSH